MQRSHSALAGRIVRHAEGAGNIACLVRPARGDAQARKQQVRRARPNLPAHVPLALCMEHFLGVSVVQDHDGCARPSALTGDRHMRCGGATWRAGHCAQFPCCSAVFADDSVTARRRPGRCTSKQAVTRTGAQADAGRGAQSKGCPGSCCTGGSSGLSTLQWWCGGPCVQAPCAPCPGATRSYLLPQAQPGLIHRWALWGHSSQPARLARLVISPGAGCITGLVKGTAARCPPCWQVLPSTAPAPSPNMTHVYFVRSTTLPVSPGWRQGVRGLHLQWLWLWAAPPRHLHLWGSRSLAVTWHVARLFHCVGW